MRFANGDSIVNIDRLLEQLMGMQAAVWQRHANPSGSGLASLC